MRTQRVPGRVVVVEHGSVGGSLFGPVLGVAALVACGSRKTAEPEPARTHDAAVALVSDTVPALAPDDAPLERSEHAVFSLVDNRHAAHRYVGRDLVIDAGDVGLARYTRYSVPVARWHLGHVVDGVRAAKADRLASLEVPLDVTMARTITRVVARVHGHDKLVLTLKVNGRKAGRAASVPLQAGWQTITIPVEPGVLGIGENQLVLETTGAKPAAAIAVEWLRLATGESGDADPRTAARFDARANSIQLAKDATLLWYVTLPEGAHLVAQVAGPCKIEVEARTGDDSFAGGVLGADSARVDLTKLAGRVVGLLLTARECPLATIRAPEIRLHGPTPVRHAKSPPPKLIILWVMAALRADKLASFTPGARAQTPNLDELTRSSAVFRQFYVQGNESQTSHASLWTGLYPAVHGVRVTGGGAVRLDPKHDVIADQLARAGMYTAAVTGNGLITLEAGYARGFQEYRTLRREPGVPDGVLDGQQIVDAALARLDAHRTEPVYLFLGTGDTHGAGTARHPADARSISCKIISPPAAPPAAKSPPAEPPAAEPPAAAPPAAELARLRAIYDAAISSQDHQLGRLIAQLRAWGIWDQTMLVITSDHGEELFEDRRCGHGGSLRDSLVRVPLLVHDPARFPAGTIIEDGVEGVDLLPTLLEARGAPGIAATQGESLAPLAQGIGRGWARPSYAAMAESAHVMRIGRWKVHVGKQGTPAVGDLIADPDERIDLAMLRPVERRMLTDNLGMFLALRLQWKKHAWGVTTNVTREGAAALDQVQTP